MDILLKLLAVLVLMFSLEDDTDLGGNLLVSLLLKLLEWPGSDNWLVKLGGAELGQYLVDSSNYG